MSVTSPKCSMNINEPIPLKGILRQCRFRPPQMFFTMYIFINFFAQFFPNALMLWPADQPPWDPSRINAHRLSMLLFPPPPPSLPSFHAPSRGSVADRPPVQFLDLLTQVVSGWEGMESGPMVAAAANPRTDTMLSMSWQRILDRTFSDAVGEGYLPFSSISASSREGMAAAIEG
jgi:hypothetical protein